MTNIESPKTNKDITPSSLAMEIPHHKEYASTRLSKMFPKLDYHISFKIMETPSHAYHP
jgi:hypothetical protein